MELFLCAIRQLIDTGAYAQAIEACKRSDQSEPTILEALALAYGAQKRFEEAYHIQTKAYSLSDDNPSYLHNLAIYALQTGRHGEAYSAWETIYQDKEIPPQFRYNIALSAWKSNQYENAQKHLTLCLKEGSENDLKVLRLMVQACTANKDIECAITYYEKIAQITALDHNDLFLLSLMRRDFNRLDQAKEDLLKVLSLDPFHIEAHFEYAQMLLREQQYRLGFEEFEWRLKRSNAPKLSFFPEVQKGENLQNRTLLIYAEQGVGDTLHFLRYIALLRLKNVSYHLICHTSLVSLLIEFGINAQDHSQKLPLCDRQVPLMSLPHRLGLDHLPAQLDIPATFKKEKAPCERLKVGICWSGSSVFSNNHLRSCGLAVLKPLFHFKEIDWVCLMPSLSTSDQQDLPSEVKIPLDENNCYLDTALLVQELDLVITVDTSVAHLAGTLKKNVWLILHQPPDWRWFDDSSQSRLYPNIHIYRQNEYCEWGNVVSKITSDLHDLIQQFENKQD
jgi:tetratricopeptide (TPR) repeat protein